MLRKGWLTSDKSFASGRPDSGGALAQFPFIDIGFNQWSKGRCVNELRIKNYCCCVNI
jgi:hypothetical protein